jgi:hypothetical protein
VYGVEVDGSGAVDELATGRLRRDMALT